MVHFSIGVTRFQDLRSSTTVFDVADNHIIATILLGRKLETKGFLRHSEKWKLTINSPAYANPTPPADPVMTTPPLAIESAEDPRTLVGVKLAGVNAPAEMAKERKEIVNRDRIFSKRIFRNTHNFENVY